MTVGFDSQETGKVEETVTSVWSMRERAEQIGGTLAIHSASGSELKSWSMFLIMLKHRR
jgi:signal transduction histidine kinase